MKRENSRERSAATPHPTRADPRRGPGPREARRAGARDPLRVPDTINGHTLTIALPRGRILDEVLPLFRAAGLDLSAAEKSRAGRRLVIPVPEHALRVLIVRDTDVPAYVEHGAADIGVVGRDVLEEQGCDLYEPLDLGIGRCRLVVAEPEAQPVDENAQIHLRYATKFPELTRRHLQARGIVAEIIKLYGSIEIAPVVGLADRIVDLVSSGETLRQHHLREVETILEVSARVCVGRAAAKLHGERIEEIIGALRSRVNH